MHAIRVAVSGEAKKYTHPVTWHEDEELGFRIVKKCVNLRNALNHGLRSCVGLPSDTGTRS